MLIKNYLKIMLRNLLKHRNHSLINIGGLVAGLVCFSLIILYVYHEVSFDKLFTNSKNIYRITMTSEVGGMANRIPTEYPTIGPALKAEYPGIDEYVRILNYKYSRLAPTVRVGDKVFYEDKVLFADSSFFRIFDFPFISGNPVSALRNPESIVITEEMAIKYFGSEGALGKTINFNDKGDLQVTGVIRNIPSNTHLQFDFLIPMSNISISGIFRNTAVLESWQVDWFWTYLLIPDKNQVPVIKAGLKKIAEGKNLEFAHANFFIQRLEDIHLHSDFDFGTDITQNGDMKNLYILISSGILVLLLSSFNFINISIAIATRRIKEIGISKVLGARKAQLRFQFMAESVLISLLSLCLALIAIELSFPFFSGLLGIPTDFTLINHPWLMGIITGTAVIIGMISGLYPALYISSFEPQRILKGIHKPGKSGTRFRNTLVGIQICISVFMIVSTIIVNRQLNYINKKNLGYNKDQVIMLTVRGTSIPGSYYSFKNELLKQSKIVGVTSVSEPIGREVQFMAFKVEGESEDQLLKILNVGYDFTSTMGLQLKEGRDFSRDFPGDSLSGFIINEAAAKFYGWDEPLGKSIQHALWPGAPKGKVIGVLKDFNFEPLTNSIDPIVLFKGFPAWYVAVRVAPGDFENTLLFLEKTWKEFEPRKPFNYTFLDQSIDKVYLKEARMQKVLSVFSLLSIFSVIAGLFGIVSFIIEQRISEIGLRKVLGASTGNILKLVTSLYFILLVIAFVISIPVSYWVMDSWLQSFAFRISINFIYFLMAFMVVTGAVMGTVIAKSWRAAHVNPVDTLRNE